MESGFKFRRLNFKSRRGVLLVSAVVVLAGAGAVYALTRDPGDGQETRQVAVTKGDITNEVSANGTAGLETVNLNFQVGGVLQEIPAAVGQKVAKGDIIAKLEPQDYDLQVQSAEIHLEQAKESQDSALRSAKQKVDEAQMKYEPMQEAPELYAQQDIDLQKMAVESAQADYDNALKGSIDVRSAEISLQQAQENAADTVLRSPVDGTVLYIGGEVGEKVAADSDTAFAVVCVGDAVSVTADINEMDIPGVNIGQTAEVQFEAIPNQTFSGKVTDIELMPVQSGNGIVSYEVKVLLDKPDPRIKNGMTASIAIIIEQKKNVLILPKEAVRGSGDHAVVQVMNASGEVETKQVQTGLSDTDNIEITGGLKEGDQVVVQFLAASGSAASSQPQILQRGEFPTGGFPSGAGQFYSSGSRRTTSSGGGSSAGGSR